IAGFISPRLTAASAKLWLSSVASIPTPLKLRFAASEPLNFRLYVRFVSIGCFEENAERTAREVASNYRPGFEKIGRQRGLRFCKHALERSRVCGGSDDDRVHGRAGSALPSILAAALLLRPQARVQRTGCPGSDPGFFRTAPGKTFDRPG